MTSGLDGICFLLQSDNPAIPVKDVKLATARSLYALGKNRQFAAKLVMEVVEPDNSHPGGLLEYAKIAYEKGMFDAATQVLLRVMKNMEDDEETKKYMALCLEVIPALNATYWRRLGSIE